MLYILFATSFMLRFKFEAITSSKRRARREGSSYFCVAIQEQKEVNVTFIVAEFGSHIPKK
jgi:hypothetical protein